MAAKKKVPAKKVLVTIDTVATGRLGGQARAANMTATERSEAARKAVQARWAKAGVKKMNDVRAKFIEPRYYKLIENFNDAGLMAADLKRIAPNGEYLMNVVRRLPGGERGAQAREMIAWAEQRFA